MAYDEGLAQRIREALGERRDVDEKKMFGGIAFMVRGRMTVGIVGEKLMVKVGRDAYASCVAMPHASPMTFTGKPSVGMVYVAPEGVASDDELARWLDRALAFNEAQPAKSGDAQAKRATKRSAARESGRKKGAPKSTAAKSTAAKSTAAKRGARTAAKANSAKSARSAPRS